MNWLRKAITARLMTIFVAERGERFITAISCRGVIYVITDYRLMRYDPDREEVTVEHYMRSF